MNTTARTTTPPPTDAGNGVPGTPPTPPTPPSRGGVTGPESLLLTVEDTAATPRPDQKLVYAKGVGERLEVTETLGLWARLGARGGMLGHFVPSVRSFLVRTSLRDEGPNVVGWHMASRVDENQGPDGTRIGLRVRGWVAPQYASCFVAFACRNPGLREALEHRIELAFMEALPRVVEGLGDQASAAADVGVSGRSNPKRLTREVERRLAQ